MRHVAKPGGIRLKPSLPNPLPGLTEDPDAPGQDGRTLFWRWQKDNWAVRKGTWKLVDSTVGRSGTFTDEVWFDHGIVGQKSLFNLDESPSVRWQTPLKFGNDQIGVSHGSHESECHTCQQCARASMLQVGVARAQMCGKPPCMI